MFLFLFLHAVKGKSAFNTGHARQFRFPFTFIQTGQHRENVLPSLTCFVTRKWRNALEGQAVASA